MGTKGCLEADGRQEAWTITGDVTDEPVLSMEASDPAAPSIGNATGSRRSYYAKL
jgi:hypothetical protein